MREIDWFSGDILPEVTLIEDSKVKIGGFIVLIS